MPKKLIIVAHSNLRIITCVRINIEGSESTQSRGGRRTLSIAAPLSLFELNDFAQTGNCQPHFGQGSNKRNKLDHTRPITALHCTALGGSSQSVAQCRTHNTQTPLTPRGPGAITQICTTLRHRDFHHQTPSAN